VDRVSEGIVDIDLAVDLLANWVNSTGPGTVMILSGAGLSTESGIPDYRGPTGRARAGTPMQFAEFVGDARARQRYWARSHVGWNAIASAQPNAGHHAVTWLQQQGWLSGVVTQNVDCLHQAAGGSPVIDLHGSLDRVICLACGRRSARSELAERLSEANPDFRLPAAEGDELARPDGDVELAERRVAGFKVLDCLSCWAGPLKPDVVLFGETVPAQRVSAAYAMLAASSLLLVLGSSLTVASGFRFVRHAASEDTAVVIVNQGQTRGDPYAALKIDLPLGQLLPAVVSALPRLHDLLIRPG